MRCCRKPLLRSLHTVQRLLPPSHHEYYQYWTLLDSFLTDEIWRGHITIFYHRRDNGHYWTVFSLYFITDEIWRWYFHYILSRTIFGSAKSRQKFQTIFAIYIAIKLTDITARVIWIAIPALVLNLPTRWRHLKIQIEHSIGFNFGH